MERKTIYFEKDETRAIVRAAREAGMTTGEFVRQACSEKLSKQSSAALQQEIEARLSKFEKSFTEIAFALSSRVSTVQDEFMKELSSGLADELDEHKDRMHELIARLLVDRAQASSSARIFDGMELPPVIRKP